MFSFGQQEPPAKTASNAKKSRRVSLAGRSLVHRNDENSMPAPSPPRGQARGSVAGKGAPVPPAQQALLQAAMPVPAGPCPVGSTPSRQGASNGASSGRAGGDGGAAATQMFNHTFELKRRQQELESMVQGCEAATKQLEEQNAQLRLKNCKAQADLVRANARADSASAEVAALRRDIEIASANADSTSAEITDLRRGAEKASEEIASLRREAATAREESARALEQARAEAKVATTRAEKAKLTSVRLADELSRAKKEAVAKAEDASRKATKALKAEASKAAKAAAAKAAAEKAAATARATAAAAELAAATAIEQAEKKYSQQHMSEYQSLAVGLKGIARRDCRTAEVDSSCSNPGPKRCRGGTRSTVRSAVPGPRGGGPKSDKGRSELPELAEGFCNFLAAYTGQDLPLGALLRLLGAAPALVEGGVIKDGDGEKDVPPRPPLVASEGTTQNPRGAAAEKEKSASAITTTAAVTVATLPAAASPKASKADSSVMATPSNSPVTTKRPPTNRREALNAKLKQREMEAQEKQRVLREEQERRRAERQSEARQKRKLAASRDRGAEAAVHDQAVGEGALKATLAPSSAVPPPPPPPPPPPRPKKKQEQELESSKPQAQEHPPHRQVQPKQKKQQEEELHKNPLNSQNTSRKRAKQAPVQQQDQKRRREISSKMTGREPEEGGRIQTGKGSSGNATSPEANVPDGAPPQGTNRVSGAEAQLGKEASLDPPADHGELGGIVEEVPMPTGDIDDIFFCAPGELGGGGIGLIVGGGGSECGGYGVVGDWAHQQGESVSAIDGVSDPAVFPGEKSKKSRGKSRKLETHTGTVGGAGGVAAEEAGEEGCEGGSKKKRRRSVRMVKAPIKFGSEEPQPEEACGARGVEPKQVPSRRPDPSRKSPAGLATERAVAGSEGCTLQTTPVSPARIPAKRPPAEGTAATAPDGATASTAAAAVRAGPGAAVVAAGQKKHAPPPNRKPATPFKSKRNTKTNRSNSGVVSAGALPVVAASSGAGASAATMSKENMFATATVAKMTVDSLFDNAARELSSAEPPRLKPPTGAAATAAKVAGETSNTPSRSVYEAAKTSGGREPVLETKRRSGVVVGDNVIPFGSGLASAVTTRDIIESISSGSWAGGGGGDMETATEKGSRGVLTGVLATAHVVMLKHMETSRKAGIPRPLSAVPPDAMRNLNSLLTAIVSTEACAMKHELRARMEPGETPTPAGGAVAGGVVSLGAKREVPAAAGRGGGGNSRKKKKRVRFCAFDLSTVDMPSDAIEDSDAAAKEVAGRLARVVECSKLVHESLAKDEGGGLAAVLKVFMRGLKTVVVAGEPGGSSSLVASVEGALRELGTEIPADVIRRAAMFLLGSMEWIGGGDEVVARCPLRRRLAVMLSALIRHKLRIMFNPPPPKSFSSIDIADGGEENGPLKAYEVIKLVPEQIKRGKKQDTFDPTRDGAASAVLSRALRRLHGFTEQGAVDVTSRAEAFLASVEEGKSDLSDEERVFRVQQHYRDTVDILAAFRAKNFVLELLGCPGVDSAISRARGWGELEQMSTELKEVKDCPDADASFSLLADMRELKAWLGQDALWRHDQRAVAVLTKLDAVLVSCDKKEAKRLSQEARRRMWFPRVVAAPERLQEAGD